MEPAPELEALLARYYAASARGDVDFLAQLIARDPGALVVGTAAEEWWSGGDHILATWTAAWRGRGGFPIAASHPQAFRAGPVGWAADRAEFCLPDGRRLPFRLTAVFAFMAPDWKLVQAHFSFGVPNASL